MANLQRVSFTALSVSGDNYLSWVLDAQIHLDAENLGNTIIEGHESSQQDKARAMIFLRHHLHEQLKVEYLTVTNPLELWRSLEERFQHNRLVLLPKARFNWMHLRLQDFKSVKQYNSEMFKIVSILKLCGETVTDADMLEKTFSTFHASNMLLQQQYRERRFTMYSELIACLLVAEENNELLLRNHQSRPTGTTPFPEANVVEYKNYGKRQSRGRGRRNRKKYSGNKGQNGNYHLKWKKPEQMKNYGKIKEYIPPKEDNSNACHRCGKTGHWSRTCRTPKHIVDLFQASVKQKMKELETNFVDFGNPNSNNEPSTSTHLDVGDFFDSPNKN